MIWILETLFNKLRGAARRKRCLPCYQGLRESEVITKMERKKKKNPKFKDPAQRLSLLREHPLNLILHVHVYTYLPPRILVRKHPIRVTFCKQGKGKKFAIYLHG